MLRWIILLVVLGLIAFGAVWLAELPGSVAITWQDWQIETSIGVAAAVILMLIGIAALLYRLWWTIARAPRLLGRAQRDRRQRIGYEALSRGLVAVAAGDADAAKRQAQQAESLLEGQPLTMLLSAQAAQLGGDDARATQLFETMRQRRETEFLGLRGLATQACKREDWTEALSLAERAYRINPQSEWAVSTLYDLQKRAGRWIEAEETLKRRMALHLMPSSDAPRERADILLRQSETASGEQALRLAKQAYSADASYAPAATRYAELLVTNGRYSRAVTVIEKVWSLAPTPELSALYPEAKQCHDALSRVQVAQRLATHNPDHEESRIAVAVAALEARLWGEARTNLESIAGDRASPRVCRLMAQLEEAEHGDLARAQAWLRRASGEEATEPTATTAPTSSQPATTAAS